MALCKTRSHYVACGQMKKADLSRITEFLFETGTLRKIARSHRQTLMLEDASDSISSHSFRVSMIGLHLALMEGADVYKVLMMCLFHDLPETRSGDQNWIHKSYVKVFSTQIIRDQMRNHPFAKVILPLLLEYEARETLEARVTKDADLLDQNLLLKEYEMCGNREATRWVQSRRMHPAKRLSTKSAKILNREILNRTPSDWWQKIWTTTNK